MLHYMHNGLLHLLHLVVERFPGLLAVIFKELPHYLDGLQITLQFQETDRLLVCNLKLEQQLEEEPCWQADKDLILVTLHIHMLEEEQFGRLDVEHQMEIFLIALQQDMQEYEP